MCRVQNLTKVLNNYNTYIYQIFTSKFNRRIKLDNLICMSSLFNLN
ncbi:hypothetical protein A1OE_1415 [Candidatus Endolissoclinum faulkneri L2]|uniref:Uncharacterized protein n=1 Tax=Candidatus Endolissoclinum faulkneri L2 TaxID=1193729 RepID=K7YSQ5_9PROT|nr:hypothetical protein A1OE_1415 [Candidatus Endolissoclinum faulkneri L2]